MAEPSKPKAIPPLMIVTDTSTSLFPASPSFTSIVSFVNSESTPTSPTTDVATGSAEQRTASKTEPASSGLATAASPPSGKDPAATSSPSTPSSASSNNSKLSSPASAKPYSVDELSEKLGLNRRNTSITSASSGMRGRSSSGHVTSLTKKSIMGSSALSPPASQGGGMGRDKSKSSFNIVGAAGGNDEKEKGSNEDSKRRKSIIAKDGDKSLTDSEREKSLLAVATVRVKGVTRNGTVRLKQGWEKVKSGLHSHSLSHGSGGSNVDLSAEPHAEDNRHGSTLNLNGSQNGGSKSLYTPTASGLESGKNPFGKLFRGPSPHNSTANLANNSTLSTSETAKQQGESSGSLTTRSTQSLPTSSVSMSNLHGSLRSSGKSKGHWSKLKSGLTNLGGSDQTVKNAGTQVK
ncbi:hypothetical protein BKA69DRAFT_1058282 [Paraphysoderma sedebokerense]|nr:hypothetical protein BKA69DRAFT_1058282 [Paraphysoderma sedebokerense]